MWNIVKAILLRWLLARTFGRALGLLAILVPLGAILKAIGVPLLVALVILGLPVFFLLALLGVPFPLAALAAAGLTAFVGVLLALGWALLKIVIPILLVVWLIRWLFRNGDRSRRPWKRSEAGPDMI
jgi:hypothetical protein